VGRSRRRGSLTYYRHDLALVHHLGFGFNADATAPGILALLEPLRGGRVLELGCGSVPALLAEHGVQARVAESFGDEDVPDGLAAIIGRKDDA
jgi:hypothetical protein